MKCAMTTNHLAGFDSGERRCSGCSRSTSPRELRSQCLWLAGLLLLDPGGLRHLIFADRTPGIALGLLLFGFIVTFGSAAMESAIMAAGLREGDENEPRRPRRLAAQELFAEGKNIGWAKRKRAHLSPTWKKHVGTAQLRLCPPATR
jgi:hypothetical protein